MSQFSQFLWNALYDTNIPWQTTGVSKASLPVDPHPAPHPAPYPTSYSAPWLPFTQGVQSTVAKPVVYWLPGQLGGCGELELLPAPARVILRVIPVPPPLVHGAEVGEEAEEGDKEDEDNQEDEHGNHSFIVKHYIKVPRYKEA